MRIKTTILITKKIKGIIVANVNENPYNTIYSDINYKDKMEFLHYKKIHHFQIFLAGRAMQGVY